MAKRVLKTVDEDHYETLDKQEQLALARDVLAGRERDHFRMSLVPETSGGQIPQVEDQIVRATREDRGARGRTSGRGTAYR